MRERVRCQHISLTIRWRRVDGWAQGLYGLATAVYVLVCWDLSKYNSTFADGRLRIRSHAPFFLHHRTYPCVHSKLIPQYTRIVQATIITARYLPTTAHAHAHTHTHPPDWPIIPLCNPTPQMTPAQSPSRESSPADISTKTAIVIHG
jgi:hypothetical protein